jgi:predicted O-linked N-acetylglucosamine transferase (SPINDLY family)
MNRKRLPGREARDLLDKAENCRRHGRFKEARRVLDGILTSDPDSFAARLLRGVVLCEMGRHGESLPDLRAALSINPRSAEANCAMGHALETTGAHADSLAFFDSAIGIDPAFGDAHYGKGVALRALKKNEEAIRSFDRALELSPRDSQAWSNRGNALHDLKRYEDALVCYDRALAIEPRFARALMNRAATLAILKRHSDALACYDRALAINPKDADALYERSRALLYLKRFEDAAAGFEQVLALNPGHAYASGMLISALGHCCKWSRYFTLRTSLTQDVERGKRASTPFVFLSVSDSPAAQKSCAETFVADEFPPQSIATRERERPSHQKIRLAYMSADYYEHPTSFLIAGLIERHDRTRFETIAVSLAPDLPRSGMQQRLRAAFDKFIDASGMDDRNLAEYLRELEVDVLVDLGGFTQESRTGVLACRPAPIQVNYLGYPGTLGAEYADYILADRFVIPDGSSELFAEKIVRLPDCFQANDLSRRIAEPAPTRAEMELPEEGIVFCSFNNSYKIKPPVFDAWMRILDGVPGSVLWLLGDQACVVANLSKEATTRGIDPSRLVFAKRAPYEEYLARYRLADLFLDTLPFNAGATASDALWAGLPLLTCAGQSFAARMAGSLLNAVGLSELITYSMQDYESLALRLARNPHVLADTRKRLVANRATFPLFDTDRFRRNIERAYTEMWRRFRDGLSPASLDIEDA